MTDMMRVWDSISYMAELIAACLIFMIPLRKRKDFALRTGAASCIFLLGSWTVNAHLRIPPSGALYLVYWAAYLLLSVGYVWICLGGRLLQAVYCAVFACAVQHIAYDVYLIYTILGGENYIIFVLIFAAVYSVSYCFIARKIPDNGRVAVSRRSLFPIATLIVLVWVLSIMDDSFIAGFESGAWHRVIYRIIDALCCIYVLWVQISQKELLRLQRELAGIDSALRTQRQQYEMTGDTIENINRKCHDLKHQIRELRKMDDGEEREAYLKDLENDIMIYDTALQTGNRALDVVLMEKALFCKNHGIDWTCMADGSRLGFMRVEDIYAIFGNALDNAVRAVMDLEDKAKRVISVKVLAQDSILVIQIQNYYEGRLSFDRGLPVTTKKDKRDHGYGMKSIRYTAEKYNGTITVSGENQIFTLQILVPVPEAQRPVQKDPEKQETG